MVIFDASVESLETPSSSAPGRSAPSAFPFLAPLQRGALAFAAVAVSLTVGVPSAEAAQRTSNFAFSGGMGSLTFDDVLLDPFDSSYDITVADGLTFSFTFMSKAYTQVDDPLASAGFIGTTLTGLDVLIDDPTKGEISILDEAFEFTPTDGSTQKATVAYTPTDFSSPQPPATESVPGPLPLFGAATALAWTRRLKARYSQQRKVHD
jgi:hypothetical protein